MSWIIQWNGKDYDVDPLDFSMAELSAIHERTGLKGFHALMDAMSTQDPDAWKAAFWTVDRRQDPELKWTCYDGPTTRVILQAMHGFDPKKLMGDLAGLVDAEGKGSPANATSGSARSAKSSAGRRRTSTR